jgi:hypothetical protein
MQRRELILGAGAAGLLALGGCATPGGAARPKVVVVGGGYGGATAAKYIRLLSDGKVDVTLVEPADHFVSCPLSNLVLEGARDIGSSATASRSQRTARPPSTRPRRRSHWPAARRSPTTSCCCLPASTCSSTPSRA